MNNYVKLGVGAIIVFAVGAGTALYVRPATVVTKTEEVVKEVDRVKKDVVVVEHEVKRPDGTVEIDRTTTDKSTETSKKESDTKSSTVVTNAKPQWKAQALAGLSLDKLVPVYGAGVERRIIGPISAGVWGTTDRNLGVSVSLEF